MESYELKQQAQEALTQKKNTIQKANAVAATIRRQKDKASQDNHSHEQTLQEEKLKLQA